jgi:hypothetical protein
VFALAPALAGHWLHIYFGRSLAERVGGAGYAGGWVKHPAYYGAILVHAFALVLPLSVAGVEVALRRFREPVPRAVLVWAACVLLLSAFSVKSGVYAYVVVPAWISLAALGAGALARGVRPSLVTLAAGLAASAPWLVPDVAGPRLGGAIWGAVWAACLAAWFVSSRRPAWGPRVAVALVAAVTLGGFVREAQRLPIRYHVPGYRVLAATVDSLVAGVPPGRACFVSPEAPALSFYLFRSGDYWSTPSVPPSTERSAAMKRDTSLRVFVVDSSRQLYGGSMEPAMIAWLEDSTVEITAPFRARLGHDTPLRVFRR